MMKIEIKKGIFTIVDKCSFEIISKHSWFLTSAGYVATNVNNKTTLLHRLIMNAEKGHILDHINRNILDNRKSNLRFSNHCLNGMNRPKQKNNSTGYKGVSFDKRYNNFYARISINGKSKRIGTFATAEQAGKAYDKKAFELYGDNAILNFKKGAVH